jgi:hypothetical protein
LRTGQAVGVTDELGKKILDHPMSVPDVHATIHCALGISPEKFLYDEDRPGADSRTADSRRGNCSFSGAATFQSPCSRRC